MTAAAKTLTDAVAWLKERAAFQDNRAKQAAAHGQYGDAVEGVAMASAYAYAAKVFEAWPLNYEEQ